MSMICELFIVPAQAAREVIADPSGIHDLIESLEGSDAALSLEKSWHLRVTDRHRSTMPRRRQSSARCVLARVSRR